MHRGISKDNTGGGPAFPAMTLEAIARKKPNLVGDQLPMFGSDGETNLAMERSGPPGTLPSRGDMHARLRAQKQQLRRSFPSTRRTASIAGTRTFKRPQGGRSGASVINTDIAARVKWPDGDGSSVSPPHPQPPFNEASQSEPHPVADDQPFSLFTTKLSTRKRSTPFDATDQQPAKKQLLQDLAMTSREPTRLPTHVGNANPEGENVTWRTLARHYSPDMNKKLEPTVAVKLESLQVVCKDRGGSVHATISKDNTAGNATRLTTLFSILDRRTETRTAKVRSAAEKTSKQISAETRNNIALSEDDDGGGRGRDENDNISKKPPSLMRYSCPFYKLDPLRFDSCETTVLTTWDRVLQHLRRAHLLKDKHCPRCRMEFRGEGGEKAKKEHDRHGHCQVLDIAQTGVLFQEDYDKLKKLGKSSDESKWKTAWERLFPDIRTPSVYFESYFKP